MNILVRTYSGRTVFHPDTTLECHNSDFYVPEDVDTVEYAPVLFVKAVRAARSIPERFASRCFDSFGRGVLLYPSDLIDGSEEGYACACCLDHTAVLPAGMHPADGMTPDEYASVCAAVADVSRRCYVRTGDIIAVETAPRSVLCRRQEGKCDVHVGDAVFSIIF